jgi:hypothetical protein
MYSSSHPPTLQFLAFLECIEAVTWSYWKHCYSRNATPRPSQEWWWSDGVASMRWWVLRWTRGGDEEGDERETEPELSFIKAHAALETFKAACWLTRVQWRWWERRRLIQVVIRFRVQPVNRPREFLSTRAAATCMKRLVLIPVSGIARATFHRVHAAEIILSITRTTSANMMKSVLAMFRLKCNVSTKNLTITHL